MLSNIKWILIFLTVGATLNGCNILFPSRPVYIENGEAAELARPLKARVWVNVDGQTQLRTVDAQPGWYIGRLEP